FGGALTTCRLPSTRYKNWSGPVLMCRTQSLTVATGSAPASTPVPCPPGAAGLGNVTGTANTSREGSRGVAASLGEVPDCPTNAWRNQAGRPDVERSGVRATSAGADACNPP